MMNWKRISRAIPFFGHAGRGHHRSTAVDSARRAMRARDHLERKRTRERRRREREVALSERRNSNSLLRRHAGGLGFTIAAASGFLLTPILLNISPYFGAPPIDRVSVLGAHSLAPAQIAAATALASGTSLGAVETEKLIEAVESEPWVASARALKLPNGLVVLSVVERHAIARWQFDPDSGVALVDRAGLRFDGEVERARALPLVHGSRGDISGNDSLSAQVLEILDALEREPALAERPDEIKLVLPTLATTTEGELLDQQTGYVLEIGAAGPKALLGHRLLGARVARLAALLESGEAFVSDASLIDLRYADRAVLRTEPTSG